jgi:hypothetical protein
VRPYLQHFRDTDLGGGQHLFLSQRGIQVVRGGITRDSKCSWRDLIDRWVSSLDLPYEMTVVKATRSLAISDLDSVNPTTVTLTPVGARVPSVSVGASSIDLVGLWRGVTCHLVLAPERPYIHFTRTDSTYTPPQIRVEGADPAPMMSAYYEGDDGMPVAVTVTNASGTLTYDLPLGKRVM